MKAMLLAAGRGKRMRPLTDRVPKPLLRVAGKPLILYHIEALRAAGFREMVINLSHLGSQIRELLADGARFGVTIEYSEEPEGALETGGGIHQALPLLGAKPFLVVNADTWCDYPFARLPRALRGLAHVVLVDNPPHHLQGDFCLASDEATVCAAGGRRLTFSGISMLCPELFDGSSRGRFPLGPLLHRAVAGGQVSGEHYRGDWRDIGTPQRLTQLDAELRAGRSTPHHRRLETRGEKR